MPKLGVGNLHLFLIEERKAVVARLSELLIPSDAHAQNDAAANFFFFPTFLEIGFLPISGAAGRGVRSFRAIRISREEGKENRHCA